MSAKEQASCANPRAVEEVRGLAANAAEHARGVYYTQALRFWRIAPGGARIVSCLREAAALDGVELEEASNELACEDYAKLDAAIEATLVLLCRTRGTDEELFHAAQRVYDYLIDQENKRMLTEHDPL